MKENLIKWVIGFAVAKFIIHLWTNNLYGLHRDEFLYIDEGKHMAWGFMEVPPFTPFLAWIGDMMGNHIWMYKLFPAIAGALIIYIVGRMIIDLGGQKWAIIIAGTALLVSPSLLRSSSLFQPVIFNQLGWLLCAYWVFKIIADAKDKYYIYLGITIGLVFLNKYSIIFYLSALFLAGILSSQRKLLLDRKILYTIAIAFIIVLPNVYWQWSHNWPVMAHMEELRSTQLVHVQWSSFISDQFMFHTLSGLLWIAGLIAMYRYVAFYRYRIFGLALIFCLVLIGSMSGKSYYTIGAFYILFPFGAIAFQNLLNPKWSKPAFLTVLVGCSLPLAPIGAPLVPIQHFTNYCQSLVKMIGIDDFLVWEDGKKRDMPQDFADMHGWEELAKNTAKFYHSLPDTVRNKTMIYGGSYGHAGALNFYRKEFNLPESYSGNGSYLWWADENAQFENIIVIEEEYADPWRDFNSMVLVDSIKTPYARDKGYTYFLSDPIRDPTKGWKSRYLARRNQFMR